MEVTYIDHMGSDLSVVNAARVSFDKEHQEFQENDYGLIAYLSQNNHWSPFAHTFLSFRIKAPIFVARQLVKHQVGLAWNEVSRRYVNSPPEFYTPDGWRKAAKNIKQGSSDELVNLESEHLYEKPLAVYNRMLEAGVCPEQARMVLPQSMMTEWIWSGSLYAFSRVCNLRLDAHAQRETQEVAQGISSIAAEHFPASWPILVPNRQ